MNKLFLVVEDKLDKATLMVVLNRLNVIALSARAGFLRDNIEVITVEEGRTNQEYLQALEYFKRSAL